MQTTKTYRFFITTFIIVFFTAAVNRVFAQSNDTLIIIPDRPIDTLVVDTLATDTIVIQDTVSKKKDAIESKIERTCADSTIQDFKHNKIIYYGDAQVKYEDITIEADYIEFDFVSHTVLAHGMPDSTGAIAGTPVFYQGKQKYESQEMTFNFDTKKGIIRQVFTEDATGFLHGSKVKRMSDNTINMMSGSFTTCSNKEHPHYEFHFTKARVIPDDKIVTKMAYFKLEETPLPVGVPFGIFPSSKGQRSGIIFPAWGESANRGFYLENGGFYFGISEKVDFQVLGDIYTHGSWAVKPTLRYASRYRYSGSLVASFAENKVGSKGSSDYNESTDFKIRWIHQQDKKAHPKRSFTANVYVVSSNYNKYNAISSTEYLSNTFQSSIAYQTSFADFLYLTLNGSHSQNTLSHEMSVSLPELSLTMNRIYPFKNLVKPGRSSFLKDINISYSLNGKNYMSRADSIFFDGDWVKRMQNGIQHKIPINIPVKLFKYFTWTTSANLSDKMYLDHYEQNFVDGAVKVDTVSGFSNVFTYDVSSSVTTKIYGQLNFRKGPVRAIRHVITPTVGYSHTPDYTSGAWDYYGTYFDAEGLAHLYDKYSGKIYGGSSGQRTDNLRFSISNNLEIKVPWSGDTVTGMKKIALIEDLTLSGSYNMAADSLKWSCLSVSGRTTLFKNFSVQYTGLFDLYALDSTGTKNINKFEWDVNNRLFRKKSAAWNFSFSYQMNNDTFKKDKNKDKDKDKTDLTNREYNPDLVSEAEITDIRMHPEEYVDWTTNWSLALSYNLRITNTPTYINYITKDNRAVVHTLSLKGDVKLSEKWKVAAQTGWDFEAGKLSYTSITLYRDLHCWEMRFNWIPLGSYKSWNFCINIKASALQDLKLTKKRDYRDF